MTGKTPIPNIAKQASFAPVFIHPQIATEIVLADPDATQN